MAFPLILGLSLLSCAWGFLPNQFSLLSAGTDYTHQDITEIGILLAVAEFFEAHPLKGKIIAKGELTGITDITARKLFDKYYGGTISEKRFQEAIDAIVKANNRVDQDHYTESAWHFNGEAIKDANDKITLLRETTINVLNKTNPNYDAARELIGEFLHIVQMFYSNTNWPELSGSAVYDALGIRGQHLMAQAPSAMDTCRSCGATWGIPCTANLLTHGHILTSGYKSGQDHIKPNRDPKYDTTGKCSHGGPYDKSAVTKAAVGGINKDTSDPKMSPHYPLHQKAAQGAITHTKLLFKHASTGIHDLFGDATFQELLELTPGTSMVFVIDTTGSMGNDLSAVKNKTQELIQETIGTINQPYNYIVVTFNDPGNKTDIFESKNGTAVMKYLQSLRVVGGGDCPEFSLTGLQAAATVANPNSKIYVFTDASPKDADKINYVTSMVTEKKISVDFVLTGDCSKRRRRHAGRSTDGNVYNVEETLKITGQMTPMSLLRTFNMNAKSKRQVYVDNTITKLLILAQSAAAVNIDIYNENELKPTETRRYLSNEVLEIVIKNPKAGVWIVENLGGADLHVSVYGDTVVDFTDSFLHVDDNTGFIMHMEGTPVVGEQLTHSVTIEYEKLVSNIDFVILHDAHDQELCRSSLTRQRKRGHNYVGEITVPDRPFRVTIEGIDTDGNIFQRQKSDLFQPSNLDLRIQRITEDLHVGEDMQIDVKVTNKGRNSQTIRLTTDDTRELSVLPAVKTIKLRAGEHTDLSYVILGGAVPEVSTTITVMASVVGRPTISQYVSRTFTVHP